MDGFRWLNIMLVAALLLAGPLAPVTRAQQPEAMKAPGDSAGGADVAYGMGAVAVNVIHIPGKLVLCALGGALGLVTLGITFGSGYRAAARVVQEGCGSPWVITAKDLKEVREEPGRMY